MNELYYIEITFENCETMSIDAQDINYIYIDGITDSYCFRRYSEDNVFESDIKECKHFVIILEETADIEHKAFGVDDDVKETVFQRLTEFNDITSIELHKEKENITIQVPWNYENEEINSWQESKLINNNKQLRIEIKER